MGREEEFSHPRWTRPPSVRVRSSCLRFTTSPSHRFLFRVRSLAVFRSSLLISTFLTPFGSSGPARVSFRAVRLAFLSPHSFHWGWGLFFFCFGVAAGWSRIIWYAHDRKAGKFFDWAPAVCVCVCE